MNRWNDETAWHVFEKMLRASTERQIEAIAQFGILLAKSGLLVFDDQPIRRRALDVLRPSQGQPMRVLRMRDALDEKMWLFQGKSCVVVVMTHAVVVECWTDQCKALLLHRFHPCFHLGGT